MKLPLMSVTGEAINVEELLHAWVSYDRSTQVTLLYPGGKKDFLDFASWQQMMDFLDQVLEANPAFGRVGNELINVSKLLYCWVDKRKPVLRIVFEKLPDESLAVEVQSVDAGKEAVEAIIEHSKTIAMNSRVEAE